MICPKCELPQENYTPLLPWKGCRKCRFGVIQYRLWLHNKYGSEQENWEGYKKAMKKAFDRLEVEKMIEGVDK